MTDDLLIITRAELQQAIDALDRWYDESGIWPEELHLVDTLLRAVQEREGPKYAMWVDAILADGSVPRTFEHTRSAKHPICTVPLYTLPEIHNDQANDTDKRDGGLD